MIVRATSLLAILALMLTSCSGVATEPVAMSVIGTSTKIPDPNMGMIGESSRVLLPTTAQGLVGFDAADQVQPALAERWMVTDDGLSYIFRLREAQWAGGAPVTAWEVAASLKHSMSSGGRNRLRGLFFNVAAVIPMTGEVIEIRLRAPEPNLLQLLAQPEMAVFRKSGGSGPYRIHSQRDGVLRLRPTTQNIDEDEGKQAIDESRDIRLRSERAALAIARFKAGDAQYLTGGTFLDLPLARAAKVGSERFQIDPAYGLFGLGVAADSKLLASGDARLALSLALDREALTQGFGVSDWSPALSILPDALDSSAKPAAMQVLQQSLEERRTRARSLMAGLRNGSKPIEVKIALPEGDGSRLLFAGIAADWRRIGVRARRVPQGQNSDLFLIDEVAPVSSGIWYLLRLSCVRALMCSQDFQTKLSAVMSESDLVKRSLLISAADAALVSENSYLPIALPLRWSLVDPELVNWHRSAFAIHPAAYLR